MGYNPPSNTTCYFPDSSTLYNGFTGCMSVAAWRWEFWDSVLHEYGHKLQHHFGIWGLFNIPPFGEHRAVEDQIANRRNKSDGIRMAWSEGWPTFFAVLVTQYFASDLTGVPRANTTFYRDDFDLKDTHFMGEGCELSVAQALYHLYDNDRITQRWDTIALGHSVMWKAAISSKANTISEFLNYIRPRYLYGADDYASLGELLSRLGMSSTSLSLSGSKLTWSAGGTSSNTFNAFEVSFYGSGVQIYRTLRQTSTTYIITAEIWEWLLNTSGQTTFYVQIMSYQTNSPMTGAYFSAMLSFSIPKEQQESITFSSGTRIVEKEVVLRAGGYLDLTVTFPVTSYKTFQTFGLLDSYLELYDSKGTRIATDDDNGYKLNAYINYYCLANVQYRLRVRFFSASRNGLTRLMVSQGYGYNTFNTLPNCYTGSYLTGLKQDSVRLLKFTPSYTTYYRFGTLPYGESIDTYLYIIDPGSAELTAYRRNGNTYDDDSGGNWQAFINTWLQAGVPYLIVFSRYNPSTVTAANPGNEFVYFIS